MPSHLESSSSISANVVGVHFKVGRKIGEGSFGVIYQGKSKSSLWTDYKGARSLFFFFFTQ
jgi:hypothetical protein